jgi:hypothetical protein
LEGTRYLTSRLIDHDILVIPITIIASKSSSSTGERVLVEYHLASKILEAFITTGIAFFDECLRHSAKAFLHSAKALPSVTLGKEHSAKISSAKGSLPSAFFGHSAKTLPSVKKQSAKKNTRQIKNRKNKKKTAKHFLNSRNNSPTLPYYLTRCPIIFHYYFESNLYVL